MVQTQHKMKKILVTGGSGFIGTNFIEKLNKKKYNQMYVSIKKIGKKKNKK